MTPIPGTGTPQPIATPQTPSAKPMPPVAIPMVDVDMPAPPAPAPTSVVTPKLGVQSSEPWYMTLYAWMGYGTLAGVIIALVGIYLSVLLWLAPFGPPVAAICWYIQKKVRTISS